MILLVAAMTAACSDLVPPDTLTLGASLPLSSSEANRVGTAWRRGYERAVADVNLRGGLLLRATGQRVRVLLQVRDDGGQLARAEKVAEQLLTNGAAALLATPDVVRMAAQAAVARRHSRPYVVPASAGPELQATERPWVLVAGSDAGDEEGRAYRTATAALDALASARSLESEAVRRSFWDIVKQGLASRTAAR